MRLLILNWRDLEHPCAGGSEVYAQNLARHWAAAGHDVTFFCSTAPGLAALDKRDGYTIIRRGSRFSVYREARVFYKQEGRGGFDAVLDVVNTRPFLTPRWVSDARVVALVHQIAGEVWRYETPFPAHLIGRYILEPLWLAAYHRTAVLTVSESTRRSLLRYRLTNVSVVHEGVDPATDRGFPPKANVPTIIFVSRLTANKRPEHALAAHALVRRELPLAQLWIVGDGPLGKRLRRSAGEGVTFFGRVDQRTKEDLMASAHALVATSVREGWGLTVSEAALLGTPTVAYNVPGLRDSVSAAGGAVTDPSPEALASELVSRLQRWRQQGRAELGDAGVLPWAKVAEEVLAHLVQGVPSA